MEKSRILNDVLFSGSLSVDEITKEYEKWAENGNYLKVKTKYNSIDNNIY
jgi:hypothetical protein